MKSVFVTIIMEEFKFYAKFVSKQNILNPIDCSRSSFKYIIIFDESSVPPFSKNFVKLLLTRHDMKILFNRMKGINSKIKKRDSSFESRRFSDQYTWERYVEWAYKYKPG